jgi:superfamily II DNA/RNA helicase
MTFAELGLSAKVQAAIEAAGYATPTPIQCQAIPVAVTGRDILGIAQTGTGKTASFTLPMLTRLETGRARARMPRSLILAPTRELAAQVAQSFEKYGVNHKLTLALLIGGVSFDDQNRKLDRGVDVLIATPGRLLDHFQRGKLLMTGVEILVIDEADRMLDMGFIPDIERICKLLPPRRQTLFFSATMPPEIQRLVDSFLKDPARIEVAKPATTVKAITQRFQFCRDGADWAKRELLRELIRGQNVKNAIIFCNRKRDVAILHKSLVKHGFNAGALHGDMDQKSRTETLDAFRAGQISLLAASDVAARGLDIPEVSHIFNFDVPWAGDDYVHRIGRTGRAGRDGFAATLVTAEELKLIKEIERVTGDSPTWLGESPSEQDFADAGRRRRGRGRGGPGQRRPERPAGRPERSGQARQRSDQRAPMPVDAPQPRVEAVPERTERPKRRTQPVTEQPQPDVAATAEPQAATRARSARGPARKPRREGARRDDKSQPEAVASPESQTASHARPARPAGKPPREGARRDDKSQPEAVAGAEPQTASHARPARPAGKPPREGARRDDKSQPEAVAGAEPQTASHARSGRPAGKPPREGAQRDGKSQPAVGFADKIPAFLRKSVRPAKAANK